MSMQENQPLLNAISSTKVTIWLIEFISLKETWGSEQNNLKQEISYKN